MYSKILPLDFMAEDLTNSLTNDFVNPIALRKAKIVYNFGLSECNLVKLYSALNNRALFDKILYINSKDQKDHYSVQEESGWFCFIPICF